MISARELLEQADALMRRGRAGDDDDVPVLEDVVESGTVPRADAKGAAPEAPIVAATTIAEPPMPDAITGQNGIAEDFGTVGEVPGAVVNDPGSSAAQAEAKAVEPDVQPTVVEGKEAGFVAFGSADLPPPQPIAAWIPGLGAGSPAPQGDEASDRTPARGTDRSPPAEPVRVAADPEAKAGSPGDPRPQSGAGIQPEDGQWSELREQLFATVVQRLELLTDQALADQLALRVRPVIDRASAELLERISGEMRELVRDCVGDAIDREIAAMRQGRKPSEHS